MPTARRGTLGMLASGQAAGLGRRGYVMIPSPVRSAASVLARVLDLCTCQSARVSVCQWDGAGFASPRARAEREPLDSLMTRQVPAGRSALVLTWSTSGNSERFIAVRMVAELAVRAGPVRARRVVGRVSGATGAASPADSRTGLSAGCAQNACYKYRALF